MKAAGSLIQSSRNKDTNTKSGTMKKVGGVEECDETKKNVGRQADGNTVEGQSRHGP